MWCTKYASPRDDATKPSLHWQMNDCHMLRKLPENSTDEESQSVDWLTTINYVCVVYFGNERCQKEDKLWRYRTTDCQIVVLLPISFFSPPLRLATLRMQIRHWLCHALSRQRSTRPGSPSAAGLRRNASTLNRHCILENFASARKTSQIASSDGNE